jgi:NADP-dependent 3-hydroxy acid dehydrogenase YdfG
MTDFIFVIGVGGQAIARRVNAGKHVLLADRRQDNVDAAAKVLDDAGLEASVAIVNVSWRHRNPRSQLVQSSYKSCTPSTPEI